MSLLVKKGLEQTAIEKVKVIDVVGVSCNGGTRSCTAHHTCGDAVVVSDKLYCSWEIQPMEADPNENEEVVKVFKIETDESGRGLATCHVGYIPRWYFFRFNPVMFDQMYLRVKEDLRLSNNKQELNRSVKNYGILVCEIIRNDFRYNSYNPFEEPCEVSSLDSKTMIPPSLQQRINEVKAAEKEKDDETKGEDEQSDPDSDVESKKWKKQKIQIQFTKEETGVK